MSLISVTTVGMLEPSPIPPAARLHHGYAATSYAQQFAALTARVNDHLAHARAVGDITCGNDGTYMNCWYKKMITNILTHFPTRALSVLSP